jgi:hypothetical protein
VRAHCRYLYIEDVLEAQRAEHIVEAMFIADMLNIQPLTECLTESVQQSLLAGGIGLQDLPSFIYVADLMRLPQLRQMCIQESLKHFSDLSFDGIPAHLQQELRALKQALRECPYFIPKHQTFGCAREFLGVLQESLVEQVSVNHPHSCWFSNAAVVSEHSTD